MCVGFFFFFFWILDFRYGSIFKTNVAGRPVIISGDADFNNFILKQDGKLVETWSMDTFAEVFDQEMQSSKKYTRHLALNHFGVEALREKLLPEMECFIRHTLQKWSSQDSVEVKSAAITVSLYAVLSNVFCRHESEQGSFYPSFFWILGFDRPLLILLQSKYSVGILKMHHSV